ncbi:MAG: hypothetical protein PF569_04995 [Candidatus Woesearchaeota archaeon]|jgi:hypothetical protein|nr:hypothetical protein [Candidatus Woesearchaeota archaeon]
MRGYDQIAGYCDRNDDCVLIADSFEKDEFVAISKIQGKKTEFNPDGDKKYSYRIDRQFVYDNHAIIKIRGAWPYFGEGGADKLVLKNVENMETCMKNLIDNSLNDGSSKIKSKLLVEKMPLKNIIVYNEDDEDDESKWTTTNDKGEFELKVKNSEEYDFVVDMTYRSDGHDYFKLIGDNRQEAYKLIFHVEDDEIMSISIDNGDFKLPIHGIDIKIGGDINLDKPLSIEEGLIGPLINYIHFTEVLEYYKDVLKVNLKERTLDVLLYSGGSASYNYENDRSWILMNKAYSKYENEYRPFVAYHEFSHYVQHMLYGKTFEESLELFNINHGGYANPTTSDSFTEGFAAFMPVIIANHYERYWAENVKEKRVSLYPLSGSLDDNWKAWDRQGKVEEYAIAGILWDLFDGKVEEEAEFKSMQVEIRELMKEVIAETDMDKDGSWNKQEMYYIFLMENINLNYDDYLDNDELNIINDTELVEYMKENKKIDSDDRILTEDFWDYMVLNWDDLEKDWKKEMPDMYAKMPDRVTVDDLMEKLKNTHDDDGVDLTFEEIWEVLKKPHADFSVVYNSFSKIVGKTELDEVFVSHGFFMETSEGNNKYDKGEPFQDLDKDGKWDSSDELYVDLGEMKFDGSEKIGIASNYDRKLRKSFEPLEGEFVKVNPEIPFYELKYIVYGNDYYGLKIPSDIYTIRASNENGMIYVPMVKDAIIEIIPLGVEVKSPLIVSVAEFEENYEEVIEEGYFVEHEFDYEGEVPVYVDPFEKSSNSFSFWFVLIIIGFSLYIILNKKKKKNKKQIKKKSKK